MDYCKNVFSILGIIFDHESIPSFVYDGATDSSLLSHLVNPLQAVTYKDVFCWVKDLLAGMQHLSSADIVVREVFFLKFSNSNQI
jgi:hypothetical protein